jgi:hypothetical protein
MHLRHDPLWLPGRHEDDDLARIEKLLQRYRHVVREPLPDRLVPPPSHRRWRLPLRIAATCAIAASVAGLAIAAWLPWRLAWTDHAPWTVAGAPDLRLKELPVGESLVTAAGQHASVRVARIGVIDLSPDTRMTLVETRRGHHRVSLDAGHIRARIWAPPGYFGVIDGKTEVVDLGCEFDLWKTSGGRGRLQVGSGWVVHDVDGQETLVPAGYAIDFDDDRAGIPVRPDASATFRAAVDRLDATTHDGKSNAALEHRVAGFATSDDAHTLLSLLTRHPTLASGPLYTRLGGMLGAMDDHSHRRAWVSGSTHAINAWWDRVPRPPKQWWRNWRDALL